MSNPDRASSDRPLPAIILAAGLSARMAGRFKPLLPIAGQPMIARVVHYLSHVPDIHPILLVTGHRADAVKEAVGGDDVHFVFNRNYEIGGMVSSAQTGVHALPPAFDGFVLSLGDQPAVQPETLSYLIQAWRNSAAAIAVPAYHGKRGHPVVLSGECAADVLDLQPHQTLKTVIERYKDRTIEVDVDDPGVVTDVDTPDDYDRLLEYWDQHLSPNEPTRGAGHAPNDR